VVKLSPADIRTRQVLRWTGLHLFHSQMSSCSQKVRTYLGEKGLAWESHPIDIVHNENTSEYFLGINPRGLVPVLIDDGEVHIESNDIILHLEEKHPFPPLLPANLGADIAALLRHEDELHLDLRNITFHYLFVPPISPKSTAVLARYKRLGAGTVHGLHDEQKAKEIAFWAAYKESGVGEEKARQSALRFSHAFETLEKKLSGQAYLLGAAVSVLDIAWFVYANRLRLAGYPLARHPHLSGWYQRLSARPGWAEQTAIPEALQPALVEHRAKLEATGRTLAAALDPATLEQTS